MVYPVDFSIKVNGSFCTVHTVLIYANSVSECWNKAEGVRDMLPHNKSHQIHIFIEA